MPGKVVVFRHGQKDGDKLTGKGIAQIKAITQAVAGDGNMPPEAIFFSGVVRTAQCAAVAVVVSDCYLTPKIEERLHYDGPFEKIHKRNAESFNQEVKEINKAGGMVSQALEISEYARVSRAQLTRTIIAMSKAGGVTYGFSHGTYASLAVPEKNSAATLYDIPEATAVVYTVEEDLVVDSYIISLQAPEVV